MIKPVKAFVVVILMITSSYVFAAEGTKVVVIPLGADAVPATGLEFTCPPVGFFPESQANYYGDTQRATTADLIYYTCPVHLPKGAKITKLFAVIRDNSNSAAQYGFCTLRRTNYTTLQASTLASTPITGAASIYPQFLVDSSISNPDVITNHGYYIKCRGYKNTVTIVGATVTYDE